MKKIPTLFKREFDGHNIVKVLPELSSDSLAWVLEGEGEATLKIDGACCAIINGTYYKRYDAKKGKNPPQDAIPCCDPDPVTGHWPHWVPVKENDPASRWFIEAKKKTEEDERKTLEDGTYEAVGPHFQGNPYRMGVDMLARHGDIKLKNVERTYEGIKDYLATHDIEGIVFWKDGDPQCKIKRSDFGFEWPV